MTDMGKAIAEAEQRQVEREFGREPLPPCTTVGERLPPSASAPGRSVVYLASPIDSVEESQDPAILQLFADRDDLTEDLTALGLTVYRPDLAFTFGGVSDPAFEVVNRAALGACCALVALMPPSIPSVGVPIEVERASRAGTPVVVVSTRQSQMLAGMPGVVQVPDADVAAATVDAWRRAGVLGRSRDVPAVPSAADSGLSALPVDVITDWAMPQRFHADDAGLDLFVTETTSVEPGGFADIPSAVRMALPPGTWALIMGRSSTMRKRKLLVVPAVIDVGWRGELFSGVINATRYTQTVTEGDRISQFMILPNLTARYLPTKVDTLPPHPRGTAGFGSTGGYTPGAGD